MKRNIFALITMMTLASIFVSCSAESEEDIALFLRVGTYTGTIEDIIPVEAVFSASTYSGSIALKIDNNPIQYISLTKAQMTSTDTTLVITRPMKITIVFDSSTEATGAKATFNTTPNNDTTKTTVTLTKI